MLYKLYLMFLCSKPYNVVCNITHSLAGGSVALCSRVRQNPKIFRVFLDLALDTDIALHPIVLTFHTWKQQYQTVSIFII